MEIRINNDALKDLDFDFSCVNDEELCRCRSCVQNISNGGTCTHCFTCIDGERAMDVCAEA